MWRTWTKTIKAGTRLSNPNLDLHSSGVRFRDISLIFDILYVAIVTEHTSVCYNYSTYRDIPTPISVQIPFCLPELLRREGPMWLACVPSCPKDMAANTTKLEVEGRNECGELLVENEERKNGNNDSDEASERVVGQGDIMNLAGASGYQR